MTKTLPRIAAPLLVQLLLALGLVVVVVVVVAAVLVQSQRRPTRAPYAGLALPPAPPLRPCGCASPASARWCFAASASDGALRRPGAAAGATPSTLRVRFAGVCTLVFDDGKTAIMTDGFFSRPVLPRMLWAIAPDEHAVDAGLAALGVRRLAAVLPVHGHYAHAMDAPLVARKTGALLLGDESVLNVGRGAGLPESALRAVKPGDTAEFGAWRVTFIASRHAPTPFSSGEGGEVTLQALKPPAHATAWREGQAWSHAPPAPQWPLLSRARQRGLRGRRAARTAGRRGVPRRRRPRSSRRSTRCLEGPRQGRSVAHSSRQTYSTGQLVSTGLPSSVAGENRQRISEERATESSILCWSVAPADFRTWASSTSPCVPT